MRSFVRAVCGAAVLSTMTAAGALAQGGSAPAQKIAYINSQKIIAQAPGRAEAEAQIQKEMDGYRAQVKQLDDSLNELVAAYQKAEPTLSATAKAARQKELQGKQQEFQQRAQDIEQKAQDREQELVRPVMQEINKIIEQVRAEDGYAMVLDAGNSAGVIVAVDSTLDISDKVIARLKTTKPVSSTTSPKPPGAGPTPHRTGATRPDSSPNER